MSCEIIVRSEAETDLVEAIDWYEERQMGLGGEFLGAVEAVFERIADNPSCFAVHYRDVRRALVQRFPYKVFYRVEASQVLVIGVIHAKRHPRVWQRRV